jgi:hypothetical protein
MGKKGAPTFNEFLQREEPIISSGPWVSDFCLLVFCPPSLSHAAERNPQTLTCIEWSCSPDIVMVFEDKVHSMKACDGRSL